MKDAIVNVALTMKNYTVIHKNETIDIDLPNQPVYHAWLESFQLYNEP